ncbi:MAG: hypothetical protein O3B09_01290 [Proteobacteria bacterium]|nr:hypothetical protein [Pseudomonadota bacterium]
MKLIIHTISLILILTSTAFAARERLLDGKDVCERQEGVWREYGNDCADNCQDMQSFLGLCALKVVYACDCGENRCWNKNICVLDEEYQKQVADIIEKNKKIAEEIRKEQELERIKQIEEQRRKEEEERIRKEQQRQGGSRNGSAPPVKNLLK